MTTIVTDSSFQPSTESSASTDANLSIHDLQNLLIVVDLATQRGAFRGHELSQIGMVFDRVSQFLRAVGGPPIETDNISKASPPPAATMVPAAQPAPMVPAAQSVLLGQAAPMAPPFVPKIRGV